MRKKLLAMLLVLVMLGVSLLSGCGKDAKETGGAVESSSSDSGSVKEVTDNSSVTDESDTQAAGESDSESDTQTESISEVSGETEKIQTYFVQALGEFSLGKTVEENIKSMVETVMNSVHSYARATMTSEIRGKIRDTVFTYAGDSIIDDYDTEQFDGFESMISHTISLIVEPTRNGYKGYGYLGYGCSSVEVIDANIDEFYYFEGTDAVIGMYVAYTMECKFQVNASGRNIVKDVDDSYTGYLAVTLVNDPENPSNWKISGIYPVDENKGSTTYMIGLDSHGNPVARTDKYDYFEIDAPEELLETCFNFENKLVSENVQIAQQQIEEAQQAINNTSEAEMWEALNAYIAMDTEDMWGSFVLIDLDASPIPFLVRYATGDDGIYHYENGEVVCLVSGWIDSVGVNSSGNIIYTCYGGPHWENYTYYEYEDSNFLPLITFEYNNDRDVVDELELTDSTGKKYGSELEFDNARNDYGCNIVTAEQSIEEAVVAYQLQN